MYACNYSFIATSSSSMASTQHPRDIKIQECVFRADRKTKMTALSESEWLRYMYIRLSLRTEFDQTWQEAIAQCALQVTLCFSDQSKNKDDHPCRCLWLAEGFSTSPLQSLAERNLTKLDMKQVFNVFYQVSGSGVRFCVCVCVCVFFLGGGGVDGKQICTSCQLYGVPYLLWSPNCVARFKALPYFILIILRYRTL